MARMLVFFVFMKTKKSWYSLCLRGCFNVVLVGVLDLGYKFFFCVRICMCVYYNLVAYSYLHLMNIMKPVSVAL